MTPGSWLLLYVSRQTAGVFLCEGVGKAAVIVFGVACFQPNRDQAHKSESNVQTRDQNFIS